MVKESVTFASLNSEKNKNPIKVEIVEVLMLFFIRPLAMLFDIFGDGITRNLQVICMMV
jgi:hypothetical protein